MGQNSAAYEEQFGPFSRRWHRVARAVRWRRKTLQGLRREVLVEVCWRLGDEIMALPVFEALRAVYPEDRIGVWANYPELFEGNPYVDTVNMTPQCVDRYILLRGAPRTEWRLSHYARQAGVRLPESRPRIYYEDWRTPLLEEIPRGEGPLIAIGPGASWPTKRWRTEHWQSLCAMLAARGARIVELGRNDETIGAGLSLINRTGIREAACLLRHASLFVGCDSGLMHLALAVQTPVVALFGPTDPDILIRNEPLFHPVVSAMECQGYWNRSAGDPEPGVCPWKHACCLDSITVDAVLGRIDDALNGRTNVLSS